MKLKIFRAPKAYAYWLESAFDQWSEEHPDVKIIEWRTEAAGSDIMLYVLYQEVV